MSTSISTDGITIRNGQSRRADRGRVNDRAASTTAPRALKSAAISGPCADPLVDQHKMRYVSSYIWGASGLNVAHSFWSLTGGEQHPDSLGGAQAKGDRRSHPRLQRVVLQRRAVY